MPSKIKFSEKKLITPFYSTEKKSVRKLFKHLLYSYYNKIITKMRMPKYALYIENKSMLEERFTTFILVSSHLLQLSLEPAIPTRINHPVGSFFVCLHAVKAEQLKHSTYV